MPPEKPGRRALVRRMAGGVTEPFAVVCGCHRRLIWVILRDRPESLTR